jgi:hypothetical protein
MPVKLTAEEFANKHANRLKGALEEVRSGVQRVSKAPGQAAAAKKQKWIAKLQQPEVQAKWAKNVASVSLEDWKKQMLEKGVNRISSGIDAAHDKVVAFADELIAHQNAGLTKIEGMPDLTLEDSINRASSWIRHMSSFKRK